jgi:hypothetical protein
MLTIKVRTVCFYNPARARFYYGSLPLALHRPRAR